MSDDPAMKALEERIEAAKRAQAPKPRKDEHYSMANLAWRMVVELVAGVGIGFVIGYGIDVLAGTVPLFSIIFGGFGFAAGINVMMRTSREVTAEQSLQESRRGDLARPDEDSSDADEKKES